MNMGTLKKRYALAAAMVALGLGAYVHAADAPYGAGYGLVEVGSSVSSTGTASSDINLNSFKLYDSTSCVDLGTAMASSHSLATGDVCVGDSLEVDGTVFFDSTTFHVGNPTPGTETISFQSAIGATSDASFVVRNSAATALLSITGAGRLDTPANGAFINRLRMDVASVTNRNQIVGESGSGAALTLGRAADGVILTSAASTSIDPTFVFNATPSSTQDLFRWQKDGTAQATMTTSGGLRHERSVVTVTDNRVVLAIESGTIFNCATDAKTFSLPAGADNLWYTFVNTAAAAAADLTIDADGSDTIVGSTIGSVAAVATFVTRTAGANMVNTKATALKGDRVTLAWFAGAWYIIEGVGVWT